MENSKIKFIASVRDDRINDIKSIAKKFVKMGCEIDNILSFSGVITGSTTQNVSLSDLKIDGIKHVETDRQVKALKK
jgi:hypothetical protein